MACNRALLAVLLLGLSGCAGTYDQAAPASVPPGAGEPVTGPGRGPEVGGPNTAAAQALLDQGRTQRFTGEYAQAAASLERALRIEPDSPMLWLELGQLRYDEGNFTQAEQLARKAYSLAPAGSAARNAADRLIGRAQQAQ